MRQITPTGAIDGSNVTFALDAAYPPNEVHLYLNGQLLRQGAGLDYTLSGTTVTYVVAPLVGDWHVASVPA